MPSTAYLIAWVRIATFTIESVGIYGEETPSCMFDFYPLRVTEVQARDYQHARDAMVSLLQSSPSLAWLVPLYMKPIAT